MFKHRKVRDFLCVCTQKFRGSLAEANLDNIYLLLVYLAHYRPSYSREVVFIKTTLTIQNKTGLQTLPKRDWTVGALWDLYSYNWVKILTGKPGLRQSAGILWSLSVKNRVGKISSRKKVFCTHQLAFIRLGLCYLSTSNPLSHNDFGQKSPFKWGKIAYTKSWFPPLFDFLHFNPASS